MASYTKADSLIVGYYPYWKYTVLPAESIKYDLLTHIIHAFIWPESDGTLYIDDNILNTNLIESAHNEGIKVLISIGGEGHTEHFAAITADSSRRAELVKSLLDFCLDYGYDGIDMDMELLSTPKQRELATVLVQTLRDSILARNIDLLLTMAVPPTNYWAQWYDVETLKNYVDWFNVMTYNFFWSTVPYAVHNAPLYSPTLSQFDYGCMDGAFWYYHTTRGVPREQIIMGIPFFAYRCNATGLFQPNTGYIGTYDYRDVIPLIGEDWNYFWDNVCKVPYLLNDDQTEFITFDDTLSVRLKCEYGEANNAGGVMIWDISKDVLGDKQPLLETVGKSLGREIQVFVSEISKIPGKIIKLESYPNPFNNNTTISYFLPDPISIKIEIFTILGRKIETLTSGKKSQGWHKELFPARSYTSGEYIVRLITFQKSISKKITVLK